MRVALGIEYDGSAFHGWQAQQEGVRTVQVELERALAKVANHPVRVVCAGRTDTGVHALGQVVHFAMLAGVEPCADVRGVVRRLGRRNPHQRKALLTRQSAGQVAGTCRQISFPLAVHGLVSVLSLAEVRP